MLSDQTQLKDIIEQLKGKPYHPVVKLPPNGYEVLDLTHPLPESFQPSFDYTIGRYNEKRKGMYKEDLFSGKRNIHMGIDLGGPAGTPVYSFWDGIIFSFNNHAQNEDYGPTIVTQHRIEDVRIFALFGHLSIHSLSDKSVGQRIRKGERLGFIGDKSENGGWTPHVHFQLSLKKPINSDLPGVVDTQQLPNALSMFPDPRIILGPIY